jgi:hypothetical protein
VNLGKQSRVWSLALLEAIVFLVGCDQFTPTTPTKPVAATKQNRVPVHRFVLTRNDFDVAFDTQTGQLCRTWGWVPLGKPAKPDPETGNSPQRQFGEMTPTCLSLYQQFPSGMDPQSESVTDEQPAN